MKNMGFRPALVICSGARRARETMEAVRPCLGDPAFSVEPSLYLADMGILLRRLRQEETGKVMMIGHNPGLARLAIALAGDGPPTRSEEHTSELKSLMRISYAVFCLNNNNHKQRHILTHYRYYAV